MEKYGVEQTIEDTDCPLVKTAGENPASVCEHPHEVVVTDGGARFCKKCQKYLVAKGRGLSD